MKKNKGFTLVELIVVIAILGILAGVASYSLNYVSKTRVKKFTTDLSTMLSQCRVDTLSGAPAQTYIEISLSGENYICSLHEKDKIKDSNVLGGRNISCGFKVGGVSHEINASTSLYLGFDRATGAFQDLKDVGGGLNTGLDGGCTEILIGDTGITLVPETGFHSVGIS